MGRAKLKHMPDVAAARRAVERETAHDDRVAETILDMALDYDDGNPVVGIRNALIAGVAFWTLLAFGAYLLV
jgi:hypothetical protein